MGTVVISVDAELGWGFHDLQDVPDRIDHARQGWRDLVQLLTRYDLPATWGIVGHLMLDECDAEHTDHPLGPSWFQRERGIWADRPEVRFGQGLVEAVQQAPPDHEIASHSFSHVDFGAPGTEAETVRAELRKAREAASSLDADLRSFIFPRNNLGHRRELAEAGFECYRGVVPRPAGRRRKLVSATAGTPSPKLVRPAVDEYGLVNIPASLHLFSFQGVTRALVQPVFGDPIVGHVERGLEAAIERGGVFHVWLHPSSIQTDRDRRRIAEVCRRIADRRGEVDVLTMAEVADRARTRRRGRQQAGETA
jgi:peptidoglycan/xylan/chitin deacetylase (PgdA/CDA1 family)